MLCFVGAEVRAQCSVVLVSVGSSVCAAEVNPEDVSFTVVQNCKTVIESIEANYPEFATLITDVLPKVRTPAFLSPRLCADA